MGIGAVGSLTVALVLSSRTKMSHTGPMIIFGGVMSGLSIAAFALTAQYVGSFALAMVLLLVMGVSNTMFTMLIQNALQLMVPDDMRGRVMGFYGMTYNIRPLGAMQAGALAAFIGVPFALAIGALTVTAFAIGPGLANRRLRNLDRYLQRDQEDPGASGAEQRAAAPTAHD